MRSKYFFISFLAIVASVLSVSAILLAYFRSERMNSLDEQIRLAATAIIDSKLSEIKNFDDEETEILISDELGPDRLGKFFVVRTSEGEVLFETQNISLLEVTLPDDPKWITITSGKHFIRVLNLKLPKYPNRILQVGAIQSTSIESLAYISPRMLWVIGAILLVILILTWALSASLFRPIKRLANYLSEVSNSLESNTEIPELQGVDFAKINRQAKKEELQGLLLAIYQLVEKLNTTHRFMRSWSFQMAHELKTPLTILTRDLEMISSEYAVSPEKTTAVEGSINKISHTISSFLDWGDLISQKKTGDLYVNDMKATIEKVISGFVKVYGDRIQVISEGNSFSVVANPLHLEQALENIIGNSLKYSEGMVSIHYAPRYLKIEDRGAGIPPEVLAKIGSPFNKGENRKVRGVGLGLAWVRSICDLYSWSWEVKVQGGTLVRFEFPDLEED